MVTSSTFVVPAGIQRPTVNLNEPCRYNHGMHSSLTKENNSVAEAINRAVHHWLQQTAVVPPSPRNAVETRQSREYLEKRFWTLATLRGAHAVPTLAYRRWETFAASPLVRSWYCWRQLINYSHTTLILKLKTQAACSFFFFGAK